MSTYLTPNPTVTTTTTTTTTKDTSLLMDNKNNNNDNNNNNDTTTTTTTTTNTNSLFSYDLLKSLIIKKLVTSNVKKNQQKQINESFIESGTSPQPWSPLSCENQDDVPNIIPLVNSIVRNESLNIPIPDGNCEVLGERVEGGENQHTKGTDDEYNDNADSNRLLSCSDPIPIPNESSLMIDEIKKQEQQTFMKLKDCVVTQNNNWHNNNTNTAGAASSSSSSQTAMLKVVETGTSLHSMKTLEMMYNSSRSTSFLSSGSDETILEDAVPYFLKNYNYDDDVDDSDIENDDNEKAIDDDIELEFDIEI